ncbi:interaptin-like [Mytilus edulis]|uniref:interaptin-like n=1 Tax=Mytilus edulis TaxID=6550 RepID=UPI0039EFA727
MYTCLICYKEYKYEKNLIRHIKEHHAGLESHDCTEDKCSSTFIRRGYLFHHLTTIPGMEVQLARSKSLSAERRPSCINDHQQYSDDVSEDDTILDLIKDALEMERQKEIPSMSVEELDTLDSISDEEINACTDTDDQKENCETTCKDDDSCTTSDINNYANEFIIVRDDDDDNINDERSLMTIDNSTVQQTVDAIEERVTQRTQETIKLRQIYVKDSTAEVKISLWFLLRILRIDTGIKEIIVTAITIIPIWRRQIKRSTVGPKSLSAERRPSCINDHEQYYDDVSEDDTILDLIKDALEMERQKEIPSMSVEELDTLDNISDEEINACTDTDDQKENCETTCIMESCLIGTHTPSSYIYVPVQYIDNEAAVGSGIVETIENLLEELSECSKELKPLRKLEKNILKSREKYCENSNQYIEFLTRKNNEDSNEALPTFKTEFKKCTEIIDNTLQQIKTLKLTAAETMSVVPIESVRSNNSGKSGSISSSAMARKRVNAEVQRTKLQYAEQQTKLIKQKARLSELETQSKALKDREKAEVDADLALLKQQTEAAIAEVDVKVLEEAESDRRSLSLQEDKESLQKVKMTLTEKYVNEQFNEVEQLKSQDKNNNVPQDIPNNQDKFSSHTPAPRNQLNIIPTPRNFPKFQVDDLDRSIVEDIKPEIRQKQTLNPYAADFELTQPPLPPNHDQSVVSDLTKFLLKKDLLLSRFQNFDDCPETYASWKATFKSITEELSVTAFEEMDL